MNHLTTEDAARWVAGLTEGADAAALEAHVGSCAECAALLRREARVEVALGRAAAGAPRRRAVWLAVVPLAAAAALLVLALRPAMTAETAGAGDASVALQARLEVPHYEGSTPHDVLDAPAPL